MGAFRDGGTGSVGPGVFFQVSGFTSPVFLLDVGVFNRARAEEDVWDGRSPSLRGRSWARYATEGPALSVRVFFPVSSFTSPVFLLGVGVVDRARAEEDVWDGRSPSLRGRSWTRSVSEGPALSVWGKRVLRFKFVSFKSRCRALRDGGTGSVGPGFFSGLKFHVSGFSSRCRRFQSGVRRGAVWDGQSPSLRGRSWARYATEGPALSVRGFSAGAVGRGSFTLPLQVVDFALVGPVLWLFGVAVPNGVVADVIPFLTVTLPTSKLAIPEMPLP